MGVDVGGHKYDISISKRYIYTASTIRFVATDAIMDDAGNLPYLEVGVVITVSGSASNDGDYTITYCYPYFPYYYQVTPNVGDESPGATVTITTSPLAHGFMTVPTSAEFRRRANDFAPVIGVPGAQLEYAEDIWRPWTMGDFRGGIGQEEWDDPTRFYDMTEGLRIFKNRITLDTQFHDEDAGITRTKGVDFKGDHYAIHQGASATVRKRTTATGAWSTVKTAGQNLHDICVFAGEIWIATNGERLWHSADGTTWTQITDARCFTTVHRLLNFREALWICNGYQMRYYKETKDGWRWLPLGDDPIAIGDPDTAFDIYVTGLAVLGGIIAIGRTNGIYQYAGSGLWAEGPIIDFENQTWVKNCLLFTVVDGFLYYNVGNRIKRTDLQGAEFDVTPFTTGTTAKELYGYGRPTGGQGRQGHIYVAFDDMEGLYPIIMEMPTIDIGGWRMVYKGTSGATMYGAWFSDIADRLLMNDGATRTQRFQPQSDNPYPDYVETADLITSWFDAGDVWSKKIFRKILVWARDLTSTETIKLYFEKDYAGTWILIDTLDSDKQNEFFFDPNNIANSARKWRLKIVLSRGATTSKTPVLILPVVVSYVVRPDPVYAQQVVIRLQDEILTHDNYKIPAGTATTLKAFLRVCEAYEFPVQYTDRYGGTAWNVFITRTEELRSFKFTDAGGTSRQEDVMVVTMREV